MAERKKVSFEESCLRLEEIISKLEDEKLSLDESVKLYEEGMKLVVKCNKELSDAFKFLKTKASLPQTSHYTVVRKWFVAQFPDFRKNPLFYLYNDVKVIDIAPFIEEEQERAAELAAKKAEEKTA